MNKLPYVGEGMSCRRDKSQGEENVQPAAQLEEKVAV